MGGHNKPLSAKALLFCKEYIVDLVGKDAAIRAGYAPKAAAVRAAELLKDPRVQKQIALEMRVRERRLGIKADAVLREFALLAYSNIADYVEVGRFGVRLKNLDELPEDCQKAIQAISESPNGGIRFKMYDKVAALEALGRHLSIFNDKLKVTGNITFAELAERARNARRKRDKSTD